MEITWHDDTCFTVREKGQNLVINPVKTAKMKGEIVLSTSGELKDTEVEGMVKLFDWPGEYEIKGIPIEALIAGTKEGAQDTLIFCFEISGVRFCHLGELGHILNNEMIKTIGDVDILMIKTGATSNLSAKQIAEVVEAIEPRAIIPMGPGASASSLKDLGAENVEAVDKFVLKAVSELPDSQTKFIVLNKTGV